MNPTILREIQTLQKYFMKRLRVSRYQSINQVESFISI